MKTFLVFVVAAVIAGLQVSWPEFSGSDFVFCLIILSGTFCAGHVVGKASCAGALLQLTSAIVQEAKEIHEEAAQARFACVLFDATVKSLARKLAVAEARLQKKGEDHERGLFHSNM